MTMAKKRTSGSGMRVIMRSKASLNGTPTLCCSTSSVNSPAMGCGDSRAMMLRHSGSGRPDLTPRTITSMALANSSMNLFCRRFVMRRDDPARQAERADERPQQRHDDGQIRRRQPDAGPTATPQATLDRSRTSAA